MGLGTETLWQSVASVALVGTERQPFKPPATSGQLGQVLAQIPPGSPESALLKTAAAIALHHQAGWLLESHPAPSFTPCLADDQLCCSPRATRFLQIMLQGQYAQVLPEWLAIAGQKGLRVPEMGLPDLLDWGRQHREDRDKILAVIGQRGRWLAAQNPDWSYAVAVATEADWELGSVAARVLYLQSLRVSDPTQARELLQKTWSQESAGDRTQFLETFRTGLSLVDEDFLEEKLSDRSKEVRRVALDLLASLPASRLCQKMMEVMQSCIKLDTNPSPPVLEVELSNLPEPVLAQWGIDTKTTKNLPLGLGEKSWWLMQAIAAVPLDFWTELWQATPQTIIQQTRQQEWETVCLNGWAWAAKRQCNVAWLYELLTVWTTSTTSITLLPELMTGNLFSVLTAEQQNHFLLLFLQSNQREIQDSLTLGLLRASRSIWPTELAELILEKTGAELSQYQAKSDRYWSLPIILKEWAYFIPVSMVSTATQLKTHLSSESPWMQYIDQFLSLLQFRQDMTEAF